MWLAALVACDAGGPGSRIVLKESPARDNVLARELTVRRRDGPATFLRCEAPEVADEVHEVPLGRGTKDREDVFLAGLLARTRYVCSFPEIRGAPEVAFRTDPLPPELPEADLEESAAPGAAYLMMNHGTDVSGDRQTKILIYDAEGRLRFYHFVPFDAPDLDTQYLGRGTILYGGGYKALPTVIDLTGEILKQAPGPFEASGDYNHTVERLDDGTFLTVETSGNRDPEMPENRWNGFVIERLSADLQSRVWSIDSQRYVDSGELPVPQFTESDPYHLNALQWIPESGQVALSMYRPGELWWIDTATKEVDERFGRNTDWTLVGDDGEALPSSEWFYGEHAPEFDGDRVLLHDNGAGRPVGTPYSRAVEFTLDRATRTARITWEWSEPGWYEPIWGDVDRLPDGRVSVTRAHCEKCAKIDGQRTQVVVVDPETNGVDWRLRFRSTSDASYRSAWIDGCALFHRVSACGR